MSASVAGRSSSTTSICRQVTAGLIACLSSVSFGLAIGYVSPTTDQIRNEGVIGSERDISWFGSSFTLGVATGGPLAGPLVGTLGRKPAMMAACFLYVIGWTVISGARHVIGICIGRVLTGVASGLACVAIPTYIAEITTHQVRGALSSCFSLFLNVGIVFAFSIGFIIPWRYLATIGVVFPVLQVLLLLCVPESPRWLLMKGKVSDSQSALQWLRGEQEDISAEFGEMDAAQDGRPNILTATLLRQPSIYIPALIATLVMVSQQLGGANAVLSYATAIFSRAGWSGDASLPTLLVSLAQLAGVGLSCVLVDRVGRRLLLLATSAVMTLACVTMGIAFYLTDVKAMTTVGWLSLTSLILYIFTFACGMGPVPPVVMGEVLPTSVRGPITGAIIFVTWVVSFIITESFPYLNDVIVDYGTFWLLGAFNLISTILIGLFLPETKGQTLEKISDMFLHYSVIGTVFGFRSLPN